MFPTKSGNCLVVNSGMEKPGFWMERNSPENTGIRGCGKCCWINGNHNALWFHKTGLPKRQPLFLQLIKKKNERNCEQCFPDQGVLPLILQSKKMYTEKRLYVRQNHVKITKIYFFQQKSYFLCSNRIYK